MNNDLQNLKRLLRALILAGVVMALLSLQQYLNPPEAERTGQTGISSLLTSLLGPKVAFTVPASFAALFFYGASFL